MTTGTLSQKVLDKLTSGKLGQDILAAEAADALAVRKARIVEVRALAVDFERAKPEIESGRTKALAGVTDARAALTAAEAVYVASDSALRNLCARFESQRDHLLALQRDDADPSISALISELAALFEATRRQRIEITPGKRNLLGIKGPDGSNAGEIATGLKAINAARVGAEALKLEAVDAATLAQRLADLRAGVGIEKAEVTE